MLEPSILGDPRINDPDEPLKLLLYLGISFLADDSGCIALNTKEIRRAAFKRNEATLEETKLLLEKFIQDEVLWKYSVPTAKGEFAYMPDSPAFNRSLSSRHIPENAPLPLGITCETYADKYNRTKAKYTYPKTKDELVGNCPEYGIEVVDEDIKF